MNPGRRGSGRARLKQYVKQFKCTYDNCKFVTAHKKDLKRHNLTHTGEKPFACQFCTKSFSRNDKRKLHERKHTNEKPFSCNFPSCSYMCADGGSLKKHLRIHSNERPHQCQLCPYASRTGSQLVVHLRRHTGDSPFHCQQCEAKFKTNTDLKRHLLIHTGEKPFTCSECDYRSHLKCNLKSHIASNHRGKNTYQCEQCPHTCRTQRQLRKHVSDDHTKPVFKCKECSFTASKRDTLLEHKKKHKQQPPFLCSHCSFSTTQAGKLTSHTKIKHPERAPLAVKPRLAVKSKATSKSRRERPFKTKKRALTVTMPVVNGKRPFKCADCSDSFVREDSFRSHQRQHKQLLEQTTFGGSLSHLKDRSAEDNQTMDNACLNNQERRVSKDTQMCIISAVRSLNEGPQGNSSSPHETTGGYLMKRHDTGHPQHTTPARKDSSSVGDRNQEVQVIDIIHGNKEVFVGSQSSTFSVDNSLINVISSSDKDQIAGQAGINVPPGDQAIKPSMQEISGGHQSTSSNRVIPMKDSSLQLGQNQRSTVQTSRSSDQSEVGVGGQSAIVQSQTLGYGTSNFPNLVFASLPPQLQSPAILPSAPIAPISGQTIVINDLTSQLQTRSTEPSLANVTQVANESAVSMASVAIRGTNGDVQVVCANSPLIPQPLTASNMLQQVAVAQQQQPLQQLQQLNMTVNQTSVDSSKVQVPAMMTYVATTSGYPQDSLMSTPCVPVSTQSQLLQSSVPMGSFILNGRAISRGPPQTDEMPSSNPTVHSQSIQ